MRPISLKIFIFLAFLLYLFPGDSPAENKLLKISSLRLNYASGYDDNILRYSDRDIDRFLNGSEIHPSRLTTYDDWKNELTLKAYFKGPRLLKNYLRLSYFGKIASYFRNPFNNYTTHTLLIDQKFAKRWSAQFKYFYIPSYYLREYRDRDLQEYHSCQFTDHQTRLSLTASVLKNTDLTVQAQFEQLYYNEYFTEYDSEGKLWEMEAVHNFSPALWAFLNLGYSIYDNIGYIPSSNTADPLGGEDTEYGDGSFREEIYQTGFRYRLPLDSEKLTTFGAEYKLRHRIYTTNNALQQDPFHAGRGDDRHRIVLELERELNDKLSAGISYTFEWRNTHSAYQPAVDTKSFRQNVLEMSFNYRLF